MRSEWTSATHRFRKAHHARKLKEQSIGAQAVRADAESAREKNITRAKRIKKGKK